MNETTVGDVSIERALNGYVITGYQEVRDDDAPMRTTREAVFRYVARNEHELVILLADLYRMSALLNPAPPVGPGLVGG